MHSPNGIQAVLFDLDGTLRHNHPDSFRTFVDFLIEMGYDLSEAQVHAGLRWTHYYWSISSELQDDLRAFGGETRAFWSRHSERQLRAMDIGGDVAAVAERLAALFEERYRPDHHIPDDVVPTLRRLRELGYKVGLVSNRKEPLDALAAELGLADFFLFTLSAGQAEFWKPDPRIFQRAVELAGCAAECAVYVGDNYYADVEGARAAGLVPVLLDPHGVFPDPGCAVIRSLGELEAVLECMAADRRS